MEASDSKHTKAPEVAALDDSLAAVQLCFVELFEGRADAARLAFAPEIVAQALELLRANDRCDAVAPQSTSADELDASRRSLEIGECVDGFSITGFLASGASGEVYRAQQSTPVREVALKVYWPEIGAAAKARILREANTLAGLEHPSIARLYASGEANLHGARRAWIAMELVRGEGTLSEWSNRGHSTPDRVRMGIAIAEAVAHAHGRGVIHCDLKPENILVAEDSRPVLIDFGLARLEQANPMQTVSLLGPKISGTLAYIAPEMLEPGARADVRADIFAVGAIVYEILAQRQFRSFDSRGLPAMLREASSASAPRLGAVDRALRGDLERIIAKATDSQPAARHASAVQLAEDLRRHLAGEPVLIQLQSTRERMRRALWRNRKVVAVATAITLLLVTTTIVSIAFARDARHAARIANLNAAARAIDARDLLLLDAHVEALGDFDGTLERQLLERAGKMRGTKIAAGDWYELLCADSSDLLASGFPSPHASGRFVKRLNKDAHGEYSERWSLDAEGGSLQSIAIDSTGERIVRFAPDRGVELMSAADGSTLSLTPPVGRESGSFALTIASDGIVAIAVDAIELRDINAIDQVISRIDAAIGLVYSLAFSPTNPRLLGAAGAGGAVLIDCSRASVVTRFEVPSAIQSAVAWSSDGSRIYIAGWDRELRAYDPSVATPMWTARGHSDSIWEIMLLDRDRIATAGADGTIRFWNPETGAPIGVMAVSNGIIWTLAHDRASKSLFVGAQGGIFELHEGKITRWLGATGHDPRGSARSGVSARPGSDGKVELAHANITRTIDAPGSGSTERVALSPRGDALAVLRADGTISLLDFDDAHQATRARWSMKALADDDVHESNGIPSLAVSREGALVIVASRRHGCVALDGATGVELWRRPIGRGCTDVAVSPDGERVFASDRDGLLELLDGRSGELLESVRRQRTRVSCMAVTDDGTRLVTGGTDGSLRILDATTLEELLRLAVSEQALRAIEINADGVWVTDRDGVRRGR